MKRILITACFVNFLFISGAQARTWIMENVQGASCDVLPADGIANPADAADQLRQDGNIPNIQQTTDAYGNDMVTLTYTQAGGNTAEIQFFTGMQGCQDQLKADIASGAVVDPNSLK